MGLESAPLGAFVPRRPLGALAVPALEPGEERELSLEVTRPRPASLGHFDRIPPSRVLTAVSASDAVIAGLVEVVRGQAPARLASQNSDHRGLSLPPDLLELAGRSQPHWAGNIHVFVGQREVQRHLAQALRVYPGRLNLAMFILGGSGNRDAYAFDLVGLTPGWKGALHDVTNAETLLVGSADTPIQATEWVEAAGGLTIMLAVQPPADCQEGNVAVRVTRQSCSKTAVIEFNLDPAAHGTGCYAV